MRKWHINSDFTTHGPFYHLQKGLDVPLRRTNGKLRCNGMGYIRKGTPQKEGTNIFQEKGISERAKDHLVGSISPLFINERSILRPAWGRVYAKFFMHISYFVSISLWLVIFFALQLILKLTLSKIHCIELG